jgi:uncharacterized membrane protein
MSNRTESNIEGGLDFERIVFFSDAVFAIAITLLILEIKPPELEKVLEPGHSLGKELTHQVRSIQSFLTSFIVLGFYWRAHHQVFRYVKRFDGNLIWLNLAFLLSIAWLPYPTALLGRFVNPDLIQDLSVTDQQIAVMIYAGSVAITGLILTALWVYSTRRHRFVDKDLDPRFIQYQTLRHFIPAALFVASIALTFVDPILTSSLWWVVLLTLPLLRLIYGYKEYPGDKR